jgi:kynurenine formamidase
MPRPSSILLTSAEFSDLAQKIAASGSGARRPEDAAAAFRLVSDGRVVSAGDVPALPALAPGVPGVSGEPAAYRLTQWTDSAGDWQAVNDRLEIDIHGATSMTHIDATDHFSWAGHELAGSRTTTSLDLASRGLTGRGVLIDVPAYLGRPLDGQVVTLDDVRGTLDSTGVTPRAGDALYFSFGRVTPARADVPLGSEPTSGLSIECAEWLADTGPAVVVTDEGLDSSPSEVEGLAVPWHLLLLTVLGIPLVDRAMLAPLAAECRRSQRWEFLSVIAPLPIPGASGSPVNPLAVF